MYRSILLGLCVLFGVALAAMVWAARVRVAPLKVVATASPNQAPPRVQGLEAATAAVLPEPKVPPVPAAAAPMRPSPPAGPRPQPTAGSRPVFRAAPPPQSTEPARPRPRVLTGRFVRAGHGVAEVAIAIAPRSAPTTPIADWSLIADDVGRFRGQLPPPGDYVLLAHGPEVSAHQTPQPLHIAGDVDVPLGDLELRPRTAVAGRVLDAHGTPMAGVAIALSQGPAATARTTTAADGTWSLVDVAPGAHELVARAPLAAARQRFDLAAELATAHVPDVTLRELVGVRGTVRDDRGTPLAARIEIVDRAADLALVPSPIDAAADGTFALELPHGADLHFAAVGCLSRGVPFAATSASTIELPRALSLQGTVQGGDAATTVHLQPARDTTTSTRNFARSQFEREHAVAADGRFRIDDLPPGRYRLSAVAAGRGRAPAIDVELPLPAPIELTLRTGQQLAVEVQDEHGAPIAFAAIQAIADPRLVAVAPRDLAAAIATARPTTWLTDAAGYAEITEPGDDLALALVCDGHLPTAARVEPGRTRIVLRAPRAAVLSGRIAEPELARRMALAVAAWPRGSDARTALQLPLDARGAFRSGDLAAGAWQLALVRLDGTRRDRGELAGRAAAGEPLLGAGIDSRTTVIIDARGGTNDGIVVPTPAITRVRGVVRQGERPLAGVVVFGAVEGDDGRSLQNPAGWEAVGAPAFAPNATTDAAGKFTLWIARPGVYALRARHPAAPTATAPVRLRVDGYGGELDVVMPLPTGGLRGRLQPLPLAPAHRCAQLLPTDPTTTTTVRGVAASSALRLAIGDDGAFAFDAVRPGNYLLVLAAGETVLCERPVTVAAQPIDLGVLTSPAAAVSTPAPATQR